MDLQKLLNESIEADKQIRDHDSLLEKRLKLEKQISKELEKGEKLEDPILDYCIRNFTGSSMNVNMQEVYTTAFDYVSPIKRFVSAVNKNKGKKIIEFYGKIPIDAGEISGECFFDIKGEKKYRILCVPVKKLLKFVQYGWEQAKNPIYEVNNSIFLYPGMSGFLERLSWKSNHSKEIYVGGPGPEETEIKIVNDITPLLKDLVIEEKCIKKTKILMPQL